MALEKQSMANVYVGDVDEVGDIDSRDMIQMQRDLQRVVHGRRGGRDMSTPASTIGDLTEVVRFNVEAAHVELAELLDQLPWKAWKTYPSTLADAPLHSKEADEVVRETKFELVDVMHFLLNVAIALDMDWDELTSIFAAKHRENVLRQRGDY